MIINLLSIGPAPDVTDATFAECNAHDDRTRWVGMGNCDRMPGGDNDPGGHSTFRITGPESCIPNGNSSK